MGMSAPPLYIDIDKLTGGTGGGGSPKNYTSVATTNIAKLPNVTPKSATSVADSYRDIFTEDDADKYLNRSKERQSDIDSSFTDNPKEWYRRYRYWDRNLAQDNPRGNLNNMAFRDTAFRSRIADALNNERHLKPTDIGRRTLHMGATGTGADQAGSERWEPIETQEMRQMRANERLDEMTRGYDIERQKRIEDYPQVLREEMDKVNRELAKYSTQTGIDTERLMQRAVQAAEYTNSWNTYWNAIQQAFAQEYGLDISERVFSKLASIDDYPLRQMYAYFKSGMTVPSTINELANRRMSDIVRQGQARGDSDMEIMMQLLAEGYLQSSLYTSMGEKAAGN